MENLPTSFAKFSLNSSSSTNRICQQDTQHSLGYCNSRNRVETIAGVPAHQTSSPMASAHTAAWLAALHAHNNNTEKCLEKSGTAPSWRCYSYENDKHCDSAIITSNQDGSGDNAHYYSCKTNESTKAADCIDSTKQTGIENRESESYDLCGATSLSAPLMDGQFDVSELAAGGVSNHTSLNNSTENLSYISDNLYGDDVIILGEDAEVECEDLSLNSDDCIYAYRGEGAEEFGLAMEPILGATGRFGHLNTNNTADEETDFLEMDFEPDPLSELEYNNDLITNVQSNLTNSPALVNDKHFLKSRDRDQLYSLPLDDMGTKATAPIKALQNQSLLSKNFAGISLHLDQIQKDYVDASAIPRERLNSAINSRHLDKDEVFGYGASADEKCISAHSLPNTIQDHFNNRSISESAVVNSNEDCLLTPSLTKFTIHKSPTKVTGAKPKLLSTFSSTSSTSSKNSSKSRNSIRSNFNPPLLGSSNSFDERSVSCSEFRTDYDPSINNRKANFSAPRTSPSTLATLTTEYNALNLNDETCLDCLEKEFLSNTIGKVMDTNDCSKCHKRIGHLTAFNYSETNRYRRSTSPTSTFFHKQNVTPPTTPISQLYLNDICNFQARQYSRENWDINLNQNFSKHDHRKNAIIRNSFDVQPDIADTNGDGAFNNNKLKPTDFATITIMTKNISQAYITQALDKLQVSYNKELLHHYLKAIHSTSTGTSSSSSSSSSSGSGSSSNSTVKMYQNLLQFLLHVSKSQCNYKKFQTIIKSCVRDELIIQFEKDKKINEMEMLPVKVSDILQHWLHCPNLVILKKLDKRFQDTNILGKIANLIRQSQQRCASRRPLPEFITIPQYYPSGSLILTTRKTIKTTSNCLNK